MGTDFHEVTEGMNMEEVVTKLQPPEKAALVLRASEAIANRLSELLDNPETQQNPDLMKEKIQQVKDLRKLMISCGVKERIVDGTPPPKLGDTEQLAKFIGPQILHYTEILPEDGKWPSAEDKEYVASSVRNITAPIPKSTENADKNSIPFRENVRTLVEVTRSLINPPKA